MHIHSQNNWQTLTNKDNTIKLITNQLFLLKIFILTRSYAALRAADLDWIVGPGYSLGGYIFEKNHENQPKTMKNQPGTIKNHEKPIWNHEKHENQPRTMKNHKKP